MSIKFSGDIALTGGANIDINKFEYDRQNINEKAMSYILSILKKNNLSMFTSDEVEKFENNFADYVGAKHVVLMNSCTTSIYASLLSLNLPKNSLIAVPDYTYIGTCQPILACGHIPVFLDIEPTTQTLSIKSLKKVIKKYNIKALIHPHLFGSDDSSEEIYDLCSYHEIHYISDCAQLLGNKKVTSSLIEKGMACFSFGESKILRIGEGGAVATNSSSMAEKLRMIRHEGEIWTNVNSSRISNWNPSPYDVINHLACIRPGLNFRPTSFMASIGNILLEQIEPTISSFTQNANELTKILKKHDRFSLPKPFERTWWTYPVLLKKRDISRDALLAAYLAEGIPIGVHFPRLMSEQPVFTSSNSIVPEKTDGAQEFANNHFVFPIYPNITEKNILSIKDVTNKILLSEDIYNKNINQVAAKFLSSKSLKELSSGLFFFLKSNTS